MDLFCLYSSSLFLSADLAGLSVYVALFIAGAFTYSFLCTVIDRLPQKKPLFTGNHKCIKCGHSLAFKDRLPVLSWVFLKGRCRYCSEKIGARYIFAEVMGGVTAVALVWYYGVTPRALTVFVLFCLLMLISCIDNDTMIIPPQLNFMVLVLGIISIWTIGGISIADRIIGLFCISLPLYIIICIVPNGFGGGDIKLMFSAGFFLGFRATIAAFFIGLILGGAYGIYLMAGRGKGRKEHFAFGPFLCMGIAAAVFVGEWMINAYLSAFFG